jgi:hypothetical protein
MMRRVPGHGPMTRHIYGLYASYEDEGRRKMQSSAPFVETDVLRLSASETGEESLWLRPESRPTCGVTCETTTSTSTDRVPSALPDPYAVSRDRVSVITIAASRSIRAYFK